MTGFTRGIFEQPLVPEPSRHTQEMYAILDTVVQAVLTDENADIDALLRRPDARSRRSSTRTLTARGAASGPRPSPGPPTCPAVVAGTWHGSDAARRRGGDPRS